MHLFVRLATWSDWSQSSQYILNIKWSTDCDQLICYLFVDVDVVITGIQVSCIMLYVLFVSFLTIYLISLHCCSSLQYHCLGSLHTATSFGTFYVSLCKIISLNYSPFRRDKKHVIIGGTLKKVLLNYYLYIDIYFLT